MLSLALWNISNVSLICHTVTVQTQEPALDSNTTINANGWQTSAKTQRQKHAWIPIERHSGTPRWHTAGGHLPPTQGNT